MRRARWKRKSVRDELTSLRSTHPKRGADRYALPAKSRSLLPAAPTDVPQITASPHLAARRSLGCKEDTLCLTFRCRSPSPRGVSKGEGRLLLPRGVSKGEKPQFRPFVSFQGGAGGNRNPPAFLFRGLGGHSLFKREYPPGFSVPKRYSSAGNSGNLCAKDSFPLPCSGNYPLREHHITLALRTAPRCCCPLSLRQ